MKDYATYREIPTLVRDRKTFDGNTMNARKFDVGWNSYGPGSLSGEDLERYLADVDKITYVVRSYLTPIAWETNDGEIYKVQQWFSVTTSKHQGLLYLFERK